MYKMLGFNAIARELIDLGFAADAVPLLSEAVKLADVVDPATLFAFGNVPEVFPTPAQVRQRLNGAIEGMGPAALAPLAGRLITEANKDPNMTKDATQPKQAKRRDQALDLVMLIHPRELDHAAVRSLMAESLAACDGKQLSALDEPLESLRKSHPHDLSVAIVAALRALAGEDAKRSESAVERLVALVEKAGLEPLPDGTRPNSRQRAEAARLIPLWVVARACWKQPSAAMHTLADRLAARAIEAAGRQNDTRWMLAMLREQGRRALDRNDRAGAEAAWTRMLNLVVAPEPARRQNARPNRPGVAPARGAPVPKPAPAPAKTKRRPPRGRTPGC